ncbi:hypothetical protein [Streptomyces sp. NPDC002599]|uniref:hypothetical protein n=1 Tax=Streptomyces sp. NPDC002599 TaxID=3154421 RepID=UPI00332CF62B
MKVVVDRGWTMEVWHSVVREFIDLLHAHTVFGKLEEYTLDPEAGTVTPSPPAVPASASHELALIITDGLGPLWWNGAADGLLSEWANRQILALVHLLPRALWDSSGIKTTRQSLQMSAPGTTNTDLHLDVAPDVVSAPSSCLIPALELNQEDLRAWGQLIVQQTGTTLHCLTAQSSTVSLPGQRQATVPTHPLADAQPSGESIRAEALQRLKLFRNSASREAQFLANALSILPLNLAVMHRTQEALLPRHGPDLFSELFIAQLIGPAVAAEGMRRIDHVSFDFAPGVREHLVAGLNQQWTGHLFTTTAVFLDEDLGIPWVSTWRHLIDQPDRTGIEEVTDTSAEFLRVELTVLEALSGKYRSRARRLRDALHRHEQASPAPAR